MSVPTLLIVGCGDVGLRVLRLVRGRLPVLALTSHPERRAELRAAGAVPLTGDLDDPATLGRLGALADFVLHLAPPPTQGDADPRTRALLQALARGGRVRALVYASTSGVYGDAGGARFDETRAIAANTPRAHRRADAESALRAFGRGTGVRVSILRVPGIYGAGRPGVRERLQRGEPALVWQDDVFTNHIHADDLARACVAALWRGKPQRIYHASDDSEMKTGDYFDLAADTWGLPRPPRITREAAMQVMGAARLGFLGESRRLVNTRLKQELRLRLHYPTVAQGLLAGL